MMLHNRKQLIRSNQQRPNVRLLSTSSIEILGIDLSKEVDQPREVLADLLELRVSGVVAGPVVILVKVGHKIKLSDRSAVLVGILEDVEVISRVSVLVDGAFFVPGVELVERTLEVHEFLCDEFLKVVAEEPEQLVLLVQLLHVLCELFEVTSD